MLEEIGRQYQNCEAASGKVKEFPRLLRQLI
jgi:hypothetical protein